MSKNKPDKELNRLRHELDKEREKNQETRRQLKLKDNELDTAEKRENKIKGQTFEAEIEILRKQLAISKETVRILKAQDTKAYEKRAQEFFKMMGNYKDVLHAFQENHPALARAFEKNHPATAFAGDEVDHRNNQELGVLQINNSMQRMMMNDLKKSNKEDAEEHEKEIKAISQELKNVNENLANTTKSYDELLETHKHISKKYDDLVEATKERDSVSAQTTPSDHQQLLENLNDLTRDYAARVQEIEDLTRQHHEELDLYVEYLLNSEEKIADLTEQLKTVTLEAETNAEAYDSVKSELNTLKYSNAESAARYQEWRASMLRVANEAPIPGLAMQNEVKGSGTDL